MLFFSTRSPGVIIHVRPRKRSPRADCAPDTSRPAIGCVPTYRGEIPEKDSTSCRGLVFILKTSTNVDVGFNVASLCSTSANELGGTAMTTRSKTSSDPIAGT